jgi:mRNA-degrading endonuclease RelE of RelBE toxin-antitoxin system
MEWTVVFSNRAEKQIKRLPARVRESVEFLAYGLAETGPAQPAWPHYGKILGRTDCHHCHIQRGRPTYVAVWRELPGRRIEVTYVGTHEGADYRRLC